MKNQQGVIYFFVIFLQFVIGSPAILAQTDAKIHIYLLMGQSNMAGRGEIDSVFREQGHERVWMLNAQEEWEIARHPIHFDKPGIAGVGLGMQFGIEMASLDSTVIIGLVPCAIGGTSISKWQPGAYDETTRTHPYDDAVKRITAAMEYGEIKGMLWHQGEGDSSDSLATGYVRKFLTLVARIRELTKKPTLPVVIGELGPFKESYQRINKEIRELPNLDRYIRLVTSEGLSHIGDGTHFNSRSLSVFGKRYGEAMKILQQSKECVQASFDEKEALDRALKKVQQGLKHYGFDGLLPRNIPRGESKWKGTNFTNWTSGFWPGILWYGYAYTKEDVWKVSAEKFTDLLKPLAYHKASDHDLGFQIFCSYGHAYRLTGKSSYKDVVLAASDTLATLYNEKVGTILSWPGRTQKGWRHNTIIDNMMNLEMLFWASKNGGSKKLYDIAVKHALTTMKNHFRSDNSSYHVVLYNPKDGRKIRGITYQGYADTSMWARGQAWAIYGFTMCYRETKDPVFLDFAQKLADKYLKDLPADNIPYWDFAFHQGDNEPKDASAAAIASSALLELSQYAGSEKSVYYRNMAVIMLEELSSNRYQNHENDAILLHSTGHRPKGSEIDIPIIYADYYYLEALLKYNKIIETDI